jgi:hypothetical protein
MAHFNRIADEENTVFCKLSLQKDQGCQMVSFQTENPNLGKFWRALERRMLIYFMTILNILRPFAINCVRLV